MQARDHPRRILSVQFQHDSRHDFFFPVTRDNAAPDIGAVLHRRDRSEFQRNAVKLPHRNIADILQRFQHTDAAHKILLRSDLNVLTAHIPVAGIDRADHIAV